MAPTPVSGSTQPLKPSFAQTFKKKEEGIPAERPIQNHRRLVSSREGTGQGRPRIKMSSRERQSLEKGQD